MFRNRRPDPPPTPPDWSRIETICDEWPRERLDAEANLTAWRSGMALFDSSDDAVPLHEAAARMCEALQHNLYGPGILAGRDLPETVHHVLYATVTSATMIQDMRPANARVMRLGLAITKKFGWQSAAHGGDGRMATLLDGFPFIFPMCLDEVTGMGDLSGFFTRNPIAPEPGSAPATSPNTDVLDRIEGTLTDAAAGDPVAQARQQALAAQMDGCAPEEALALHEQAAQLGEVDSMYDAGCIAFEAGRRPQAVYWWEQAAASGSTGAMSNLAVMFRNEGDITSAIQWHTRAALAGDLESYPNLVMLARQQGDEADEFRWAQQGAQAGHWFCEEAYAQMLFKRSNGDAATARQQVIPLFVSAAEKGPSSLSMYLAGAVYLHINEPTEALMWLRRAEAAGDDRASRKLRELGW